MDPKVRPSVEREQVLSRLADGRSEVLVAVAGLSDAQLSRKGCTPEWAAKDVLSHLASWDEALAEDFHRLIRGDAPALSAYNPERVDQYNAAAMPYRLNLSAAQARLTMDIARAELSEGARGLPDSQFVLGQFARWMLDITALHDHEHARMIKNWRRAESLQVAEEV
jgi:hypothetical protein